MREELLEKSKETKEYIYFRILQEKGDVKGMQDLVAELVVWKKCLINTCVVSWVAPNEDDPEECLADLLEMETKYALDPAISHEARALVEKGRQAAIVEIKKNQELAKDIVPQEGFLEVLDHGF